MAHWLELAAARHPDRVALQSGSRELTYAGLLEHAAAEAHRLTAGVPVTLELTDPFEFAVALHACLLAGAPAIPIDPRLSEAERAQRARAEADLVRYPHKIRSSAVATVMFTSGTTSAPKPVELTYGNWLANAHGSAPALGRDPAERWLCPMPLAHVGGLSILIRSVIYAT